jgi:3-hydroxybutyryl-CoA dehydrogenase
MKQNVKNVTIAGAGIMGASFAQIFAQYNYNVVVYDNSLDSIHRGEKQIKLNQEELIFSEELTDKESQEILSRISFTTDMECFAQSDFVIEAIKENMDIKKEFWEKVSKIVDEDIVLVSNTSGLSITEMATAIKNPERFCGMHWVNPPHIVPLVEIISGDKTADETLQIVWNIAESLHRKPIMVKKDAKGFVLNRLQYAVLREALHIVEQGIASMEDVDNVMKYGLGMRYAAIGPFETVDLGGLDTFRMIGEYLFRDLSDAKEVPNLLISRYEEGAYGIKTGRGFYDYPGDKADQVVKKRDSDFLKLSKCLFKDL